jgi:uncharacterized protein YcgL (UPF0745 family)
MVDQAYLDAVKLLEGHTQSLLLMVAELKRKQSLSRADIERLLGGLAKQGLHPSAAHSPSG